MNRSQETAVYRQLNQISHLQNALHHDTRFWLSELHSKAAGAAEDPSRTEDAGFCLKSSIRALLAEVDGTASLIRRTALSNESACGLSLTEKERERLKGGGCAKVDLASGRDTINTAESLKTAAKFFPMLFGSDFQLDTRADGWRSLLRLIKARNAFTHPCLFDDLFALRHATKALVPAVHWYLGEVVRMLTSCAQALGVPPRVTADTSLAGLSFKEAPTLPMPTFSEEDYELIRKDPSRSLDYAGRFFAIARQDRPRAMEYMKRYPTGSDPQYQCAARTAVRTVFSEIEATLNGATFFIAAARLRGQTQSAEDEIGRLPLEERLVAVLETWSSEFGYHRSITRSGEQWKQFRGAVAFRDRLTHPRSTEHLRCGPQELKYLHAAVHYLVEAMDCLELDPERWASAATRVGDAVADEHARRGAREAEETGEEEASV